MHSTTRASIRTRLAALAEQHRHDLMTARRRALAEQASRIRSIRAITLSGLIRR
jgi:hypothetical protein